MDFSISHRISRLATTTADQFVDTAVEAAKGVQDFAVGMYHFSADITRHLSGVDKEFGEGRDLGWTELAMQLGSTYRWPTHDWLQYNPLNDPIVGPLLRLEDAVIGHMLIGFADTALVHGPYLLFNEKLGLNLPYLSPPPNTVRGVSHDLTTAAFGLALPAAKTRAARALRMEPKPQSVSEGAAFRQHLAEQEALRRGQQPESFAQRVGAGASMPFMILLSIEPLLARIIDLFRKHLEANEAEKAGIRKDLLALNDGEIENLVALATKDPATMKTVQEGIPISQARQVLLNLADLGDSRAQRGMVEVGRIVDANRNGGKHPTLLKRTVAAAQKGDPKSVYDLMGRERAGELRYLCREELRSLDLTPLIEKARSGDNKARVVLAELVMAGRTEGREVIVGMNETEVLAVAQEAVGFGYGGYLEYDLPEYYLGRLASKLRIDAAYNLLGKRGVSEKNIAALEGMANLIRLGDPRAEAKVLELAPRNTELVPFLIDNVEQNPSLRSILCMLERRRWGQELDSLVVRAGKDPEAARALCQEARIGERFPFAARQAVLELRLDADFMNQAHSRVALGKLVLLGNRFEAFTWVSQYSPEELRSLATAISLDINYPNRFSILESLVKAGIPNAMDAIAELVTIEKNLSVLKTLRERMPPVKAEEGKILLDAVFLAAERDPSAVILLAKGVFGLSPEPKAFLQIIREMDPRPAFDLALKIKEEAGRSERGGNAGVAILDTITRHGNTASLGYLEQLVERGIATDTVITLAQARIEGVSGKAVQILGRASGKGWHLVLARLKEAVSDSAVKWVLEALLIATEQNPRAIAVLYGAAWEALGPGLGNNPRLRVVKALRKVSIEPLKNIQLGDGNFDMPAVEFFGASFPNSFPPKYSALSPNQALTLVWLLAREGHPGAKTLLWREARRLNRPAISALVRSFRGGSRMEPPPLRRR